MMEWTRGPIIGRGSSATVYLATESTSGELFAVKSAELSHSNSLQIEKCIISQLDSPHIIKYIGCDVTRDNNNVMYNVFLEYVPGGTLSDKIGTIQRSSDNTYKSKNGLSEPIIQLYAHQLLLGINYIHSKGTVHCDIKGRNVLVSKDGGAIKIADFGCAKFISENGKTPNSAFSGTPAFMSPEVARREEQGFAADIWAFGCTVIEMATGSAPWPEMNCPVSSLFRIGYSDEVPEFPGWLSGDAKDFLGKCLNRDPKSRWTAAELLNHPFLQRSCSYNPDNVETQLRNSPTSVIDQCFWESSDVSQSPCSSPISAAATVDSPANRIRRLIGSSKFLGWEDIEEGWVSVRGMDRVESKIDGFNDLNFDTFKYFSNMPIIQFVNCNEDEEVEDEVMGVEPFICQEDLEFLIENEDFLFDWLVEEISTSDRFGTTTNVALSFDEIVNDLLVLQILYFENNIILISHLIKFIFLNYN